MRNGRCGPCERKFVSDSERQCRATKRRGSATSNVSVGARGFRSRQAWCGRRWTGDASQLNFDLLFPSHVHTSQHFTARPRHVPSGLHTASHAFADMSVDPVFRGCPCFPCRGCSLMSRWAPATTSATVPSPSTVTPCLPPCHASASLSPVLPSSISRAHRQRRFAVPLGSEIVAEVFAPWPSTSLQGT